MDSVNMTLHFDKASEQIKEMISYINNNKDEYNITYKFDFKDNGQGGVNILFMWEDENTSDPNALNYVLKTNKDFTGVPCYVSNEQDKMMHMGYRRIIGSTLPLTSDKNDAKLFTKREADILSGYFPYLIPERVD